MHPAIRVCHFVSRHCWSRACMCCPRAVARSVGLVRRHRCPRTQTRSVTLGVRGSPAPGSAVRPQGRRARGGASRRAGGRDRGTPSFNVIFAIFHLTRGAGGALLRLLRAFGVTFSFSRALGPRSGRQEPVAFYLLKHVQILRLSVAGVGAGESSRGAAR